MPNEFQAYPQGCALKPTLRNALLSFSIYGLYFYSSSHGKIKEPKTNGSKSGPPTRCLKNNNELFDESSFIFVHCNIKSKCLPSRMLSWLRCCLQTKSLFDKSGSPCFQKVPATCVCLACNLMFLDIRFQAHTHTLARILLLQPRPHFRPRTMYHFPTTPV